MPSASVRIATAVNLDFSQRPQTVLDILSRSIPFFDSFRFNLETDPESERARRIFTRSAAQPSDRRLPLFAQEASQQASRHLRAPPLRQRKPARIARLHAKQLRFHEPGHTVSQRAIRSRARCRTSAPPRAKSASRHFRVAPSAIRMPIRACASSPRRPSRHKGPLRRAARRVKPRAPPRETSATSRRTMSSTCVASVLTSNTGRFESSPATTALTGSASVSDLVPCARRT